MTCDAVRELLSARLDGELDAAATTALDDHLAECPSCAAFFDRSAALHRDLRVHAAASLAELAEPRPSVRDRLRAASGLQLVLLVIGVTLVAINASDIVAGDGIDGHLVRHDAVFGTALGAGMVSVSWRPQRAMGLVPITSVIALLMLAVAAADLVADRTSMLTEAAHALELAGLVALWLLSGGPARARRRWSSLSRHMQRPTVPPWPTA